MIIAAHRPYFCPYPGFFFKAMLCDVFVILDDVQFPRGTTWTSRNRFKNDQGCMWMTVPVLKKGLGLQKINQVKISHEGRWAKKHLESLKAAYGNAPYLYEHLHLFKDVFSPGCSSLIDMNLEIIRYIMDVLKIETELVLLSQLGIQETGNRLLIDLSRFLGGSIFLAQRSARKYLDELLFKDADLDLAFYTPPTIVYPQLWGHFIANLSVFDLIFNCGPKSREIIYGK
jgi:hypothetical protein